MTDQGFRYDVVDAVLAQQGTNPAGAARACKQLTAWVQRADWNTILPAFSRCVRITRSLKETFTVQPEALKEPSEKDLLEPDYSGWKKPLQNTVSVDDFLNAFMPAIPSVNAFFDAVLVMSEDPTGKGQPSGYAAAHCPPLPERIADLSLLEGF